jgi:geranylgeranyl reductase family protein
VGCVGDPVWDVAVVGAGPAGAAAALRVLQLRPDARVLLLDRAAFPRDKPCGDGIAPHALDVLAGLGVTGAAAGYPGVRRLRLRGPSGAEVARLMTRPACVVPRHVFDARLAAAATDRGAVLARQPVRRVEVRADRVVLDGQIQARVVIGTDGANSVVRRQLGIGPNGGGHLALALRGYAGSPDGPPQQLIVMSGADWPAYAWSFPIGDGRVNVGYGEVLRGQDQSRARLLDRLRALLPGVGEVTALRAHHLPLSSQRPRPPDGRVLLAGDALSLINPFTGEGIFYAVLSGKLAAEAALYGAGAGAEYRRLLAAELGRHLRHTDVAARLGQHQRIVGVAIDAARRDQRVFDDLVELGLGRGRLTATTLAAIARGLIGYPGSGRGRPRT